MLLQFLIFLWWGTLVSPSPLLAVLPSIGGFYQELRRAVSDADSTLEGDLHLSAVPFVGPPGGDGPLFLQGLCGAMGVRPSILLSLVPPPAAFYVSLVGGYSGVPVIASTGGYRDAAAETMNPYYVSLDPDAEDLALAASALLLGAPNGTVFLLRDAHSPFYAAFGRALRRKRNHVVKELTIDAEDGTLLLDRILVERIQVLLLACGQNLAEKVLAEAHKMIDNGKWTWILVDEAFNPNSTQTILPGAIGLRLRPGGQPSVRSAVRLAATALFKSDLRHNHSTAMPPSCWFPPDEFRERFAEQVHRIALSERFTADDTVFDIFLFRDGWVRIGNVSGGNISPSPIPWSGPHRVSVPFPMPRYRVVTALAPPFVRVATRMENGSCLTGIPCLQVQSHSKSRLVRLLADFSTGAGAFEGSEYNVTCCAGVAIDLLLSLSLDLRFEVDLYLVGDGLFGYRKGNKWNGIIRDLVSGSAHMALTALSTSSDRSRDIDYSVPFQQSGVSCLAHAQQERAVPLTAFLVPFSAQLWLAIFASLNTTAIVSAIYEWMSPFGLNPRGRSRSRNFSLASALWVMWSLLFSHLVAFKAPKSWPNKVLINLWGCFSVIFVSSYTANIAAHFAGLMMVRDRIDHLHDATLLNQRTGTVKSSSAESYIRAQNPQLWQHIQRYGSETLEEAMEKLKRGDLDVFIGDTPLLDYVRGEDCNLRLLGQSIFEDAYAVGMQKGFPLKDSISTMLLRYSELGLTERLRNRWAGQQPCFGLGDGFGLWGKARPLSPSAVAGVFIALLLGVAVGLVILVMEHMVFRYALPNLRNKREGFWKSPNLMFFSQKLYRFINIVELVSPHHSAKEIASNLRHGQIFRLFQKSMKKMNKEGRRKRNPQIYDILQEVRKALRAPAEESETISLQASDIQPRRNMSSRRRSLSLSDVRPRRQPPFGSRPRASSLDGDQESEKIPVDDLILRAMTKEEIVRCWQASEKRLLHLLEKAIRANITLEKKLVCIQRTLFK